MISLILYSTAGCHLCELAEEQLREAEKRFSVQWQWAEIVDSEKLMELYALKIPVVVESESGEELGWPFNQADLFRWLSQFV